MLNKDLLIIFSLIFFIYLLGNFFLVILNKKTVKKLNLFLNLAYSWLIGNSLLIILLSILFFTNRTNLISWRLFLFFFGLIFFLWMFLLIKNKSFFQTQLINWFYLLIIIIFFLPLIINSLTSFLIDWDAIGVWFLKAKAIFSNRYLDYVKSDYYLFSGQAYPIGLPLIINLYFKLTNFFNDQTIQLYFLMYYLNLFFLSFGAALTLLKKYFHPLILLIFNLSFYIASNFIIYSHNGYADLPLSFFFAGIFFIFYLLLDKKKDENQNELITTIIISLGGSLMIKNDALPFFILNLIVLFFYLWSNRKIISQRYFFWLFFIFIISFLPFFLWQNYIKTNQIPSFLTGHYFDFLKLENLKRIKIISNYLFIEFVNTNKYGLNLIFLSFVFVSSLFYLLLNKKLGFKKLGLLFIIFGQLMSYIFVYLITPLNFLKQLESSLERVVLQIIPVFFLLTVILLKDYLRNIIKKTF